MTEKPLVLDCDGEPLVAVLHEEASPAPLGVIVVVGGPQYRVGSHRQFVVLARALAAAGYPCLRFDYRGMGDSAAPMRDFRSVRDDIRTAIDAMLEASPGVGRVVLWGLCDGASAALIYAPDDPRVDGVVAVNPWVRSETSLAQARVRHYYLKRLFEPEMWKKVATGRFQWRNSLSAAAAALGKVAGGVFAARRAAVGPDRASFQQRMARGWQDLRGCVLFVASGNDLTAQEFLDHACGSPDWQPFSKAMPGELGFVAEADHTFSVRAWNDALIELTLNWLDKRRATGRVDRPADPRAAANRLPEEHAKS